MDSPYDLETYHYDLPPELIAQEPLADRTAARLLVVRRQTGTWSHHHVRDLPDLLAAGDCLVLNNTRVVPARLFGFRTATRGKWEGLFLSREADGTWHVIGHTRGWLRIGETVTIPAPEGGEILQLELLARLDDGVYRMRPTLTRLSPNGSATSHASAAATPVGEPLDESATWRILDRFGQVPLPPYIRKGHAQPQDHASYQTTYAERPGSVAAPTAGLHFTPELLAACEARGIETARVTLHVGLGTFRPVHTSDIRQHTMHAEWCEVPAETAERLRQVRDRGNRVVAVGTTSLRTLETAVVLAGWSAWQGESRLFVYPGYQFRAIDALLTNFHLPKSTLLMLVSAFAGIELTRQAYQAAIAARYRFYSYGDAMLIL
uniref:S-adenosylmethionine:tRNA ribosyltransferase-isomerase n=1 Tax=Schlesneria paludicola TaxID=360056 RepID=A0A7C4LN00_9PLAN